MFNKRFSKSTFERDKLLHEIHNNYIKINEILIDTAKTYTELLQSRYNSYCNYKREYTDFYNYGIYNQKPKLEILNQALDYINNIYNLYLPILDRNPEEKEYWESHRKKLEEQINRKCCI